MFNSMVENKLHRLNYLFVVLQFLVAVMTYIYALHSCTSVRDAQYCYYV